MMTLCHRGGDQQSFTDNIATKAVELDTYIYRLWNILTHHLCQQCLWRIPSPKLELLLSSQTPCSFLCLKKRRKLHPSLGQFSARWNHQKGHKTGDSLPSQSSGGYGIAFHWQVPGAEALKHVVPQQMRTHKMHIDKWNMITVCTDFHAPDVQNKLRRGCGYLHMCIEKHTFENALYVDLWKGKKGYPCYHAYLNIWLSWAKLS